MSSPKAHLALWLSWALFVGFAAGMAYAQRPGQVVTGCQVQGTASTGLTDGAIIPLTCNSSGQLRMGAAPTP